MGNKESTVVKSEKSESTPGSRSTTPSDAVKSTTPRKKRLREDGYMTVSMSRPRRSVRRKTPKTIETSVVLPFSGFGEPSVMGTGLGTFSGEEKLKGALEFLDRFDASIDGAKRQRKEK